MSIKVMTHVWEHSKHKGSELLTLLAIADFAHDDGTNAYPSVAALAKKTRMTERNVQMVLHKLEASKELSVERNAGPRGCHLFTIDIGQEGVKSFRGEKISGVKRFQGEKSRTGGVKNPHLLQPQISPDPLLDPSGDPLLEKKEKIPPVTSVTSPMGETPAPQTAKPVHPPKAPKAPKAPRAARTHFVPDTFVLTDDLQAWAQANVPTVDLPYQHRVFMNHEFDKPHSDWVRAWHNWMLRAQHEFAPTSNGRASPQALAQRRHALEAWAQEEDA